MISLKGIEKIYKQGNTLVHALKGITLDVQQGEIFGIIGHAGAGKSALIRCINLLENPSSGSIIIDQCELTTLSTEALRQARRKIGMIFQHFNLLNSRSVFDNVALPLELLGASKETIEATVRPLLNLTHLGSQADAYPSELSTGQKQLVAIARALVGKPKVLLCEDATAEMDPKTKQQILHILRDVNKRLDITILLLTHEIDVIKSICDRVAVLEQGKIVETTSALEFFTNPRTTLAKDFVINATRLEMPHALRSCLRHRSADNHNPILRIAFIDPDKQESFIAYVVQQFNLMMNIIQAHLETIGDKTIGIMAVEAIGESEEIKRAIQFLEHKDIHVEVLGYAQRSP